MDFDLPSEPTSTTRRQLNANLPIHTLPAELFIEILIDAADSCNDHFPISRLHSVAQVCSYWFHSILANPAFWRVVNAHEHDLIPTIMLRNPNNPLMLRSNGHASTNDFLEALSAHASRWETLIIVNELDENTMEILSRHPMPALKALAIADMDTYWGTKYFPISGAPGLEFIDVFNVSMPWDSPSFSGLRYLSLSDITYRIPSLHQIVAALIASPALEWLALENLRPKEEDADDDEGQEIQEDTFDLPRIIMLPALQGLGLSGELPRSTVHYLASSIRAPNCRILRASVPLTFAELASIPTHAPDIHIRLEYMRDEISLFIGSTSEAFDPGWPGFRDGNKGNYITFTMGYDVGEWEVLVHALGLPVTNLDIPLCCTKFPKDPQGQSLIRAEHFTFWQSLTRLFFSSKCSDVDVVLEFLGTPSAVDGQERWPCPRLEEITIRNSLSMDGETVGNTLAEMLEKRCGAGGGGAKDGDNTAPARLKVIQAPRGIIDIVHRSGYAEGVYLYPL